MRSCTDLHVTGDCNCLTTGVVHAAMGQTQSQNSEHLRLAQQCFQAVGSSPAECDTIPGDHAYARQVHLPTHACYIDLVLVLAIRHASIPWCE